MVRDMSIQLEQDAQQATIYAGGAWHSAGGDALDVIDPAREVAIASVPSATPSEVHTALEAARGAQRGWAATSPIERGALLRKVADVVIAHRNELAEILVNEVGKPTDQALGEVDFAEGLLRYNAEWDRRLARR